MATKLSYFCIAYVIQLGSHFIIKFGNQLQNSYILQINQRYQLAIITDKFFFVNDTRHVLDSPPAP